VDVIAHAGAVGRRIIVAPDADLVAAPDGGLHDERHQIVGNAARVLADATALVRADGIEITKQRDVPAFFHAREFITQVFYSEFRAAVGIHGRTRMTFVDRIFFHFAVHGAG